MRKILKILLLFSLPFCNACAVYDAKFNCANSRGANCVMLSQVDQMVSNGEIVTVYGHKTAVDLPKVKTNQIHKVAVLARAETLTTTKDGLELYE